MGLSTAEGKIVERVEYDAYGMPTFLDAKGNMLEVSSVGNNILFTGREYNSDLSSYYFRSRNLLPNVGRFLQHDKFLYIDGLNDLSYVGNSPILYIDQYGTKANKSCDKDKVPMIPPAYISNPPYSGPSISSGPYTGPYISAAPEMNPQKSFCERHPVLCQKWKDYELNGQVDIGGCYAAGAGICLNYSRGVDKNGDVYNSFEISPVFGVAKIGSGSVSLGNDNPSYGFDTGFKIRLEGEVRKAGEAGIGYTGTYSTMNKEGSNSLSMSYAGIGVNANRTSNSSTGSINASYGNGYNATAGSYFSWTWKSK